MTRREENKLCLFQAHGLQLVGLGVMRAFSRYWCPVTVLVLVPAAWGLTALAQELPPQPTIEAIDVGFRGHYKIGSWTPMAVSLRGGQQPFQGFVVLSVPDGDEVLTTTYPKPVYLTPGQTTRVLMHVKPGTADVSIHARLYAGGQLESDGLQGGQLVAQGRFSPGGDDSSFRLPMLQAEQLYVTLGRPALSTDELSDSTSTGPTDKVVAHLTRDSPIPDRWFGYDAADAVIVSTSDLWTLEALQESRWEALKDWVRMGGRLVVTVARNWDQVAASPLAGLLPARFDSQGVVRHRQLPRLEAYCQSKTPLFPPGTTGSVPVARLVDLKGVSLAEESLLPLVVRGPYGFGEVTLVALDLDQPPFDRWQDRQALWRKLLGLQQTSDQDTSSLAGGQVTFLGISDLASRLRAILENFEGVRLVPFGWVAFFIVVYIFLIGPADYLFLKKVLKRLELTWVTFPIVVVVVSVAAYLTALALKGREIRVNQIEVVDIDVESGLVRGTAWLSLFSPSIDTYNLAAQPSLTNASPHSPPPVLLAWLGLPESTLGGMYRRSTFHLVRRGYQFGPEAQTLIDVPVQVWSTKDFMVRWQGRSGELLEMAGPLPGVLDRLEGPRLRSPDANALMGTLAHKLEHSLEHCFLAFGSRAYLIGADRRDNDRDGLFDEPDERVLSPQEVVSFGEYFGADASRFSAARHHRNLKGEIQQRFQLLGPWADDDFPYRATSTHPDELMRIMMFYEAADGRDFTGGLTHSYLSFIDISRHLKMGRAVLVGKLPAGAPPVLKILRDGQPIRGQMEVHSYVRFVIPVEHNL